MNKTICLFNTRKKVLLSRSDRQDYGVYMEEITEELEKNIDKQINIKGSFSYMTKDKTLVNSSNTYLYGEIDLNNKKDIDYLEKFKTAILNPYDIGNWYYTSFDYETGNITKDKDKNVFLGINFVSGFLKWFKFKYCILGKPKRIIIYKKRLPLKYD